MSLGPGNVIGEKFRLDRLLGEGGMGSVWAATHLVTRKVVALKILKGEPSPRALRRFVREARLASAVQHANLVAVHDVVVLDDGAAVMVMDLLEGETLRARLARDGPLPLAELARLLLPVVDAIRAAHARGIVHRDLKPDNLFLERRADGTVVPKVLDFGIAKLTAHDNADEQSVALTGTGDLLGTAHYMAPEQLFGESEITRAADIWALGVIAHECLCGERPVKGSNLGQVVKAITTGAIASLKDASVELPRDVVDVVAGCLSVEATARPGLDQIEEVLRRHTDGSGSVARARSTAGATTTSPLALAQTQLAPSTRRSRRRAVTAMMSIAAVAIGVYFSWPEQAPEAAPALSVAQSPEPLISAPLIPEPTATPVKAVAAEPPAERRRERVDAGAPRAPSAPAAKKTAKARRDPAPDKQKAKDMSVPQSDVTGAPKLPAPEPSPKRPVGKYSFEPVTTPP